MSTMILGQTPPVDPGTALPDVSQTGAPEGQETYGQILKSSALIGGSSVANIAIGMLRTKVLAVFLGPAGFGLLSVYGSIIMLTQTFAGMGINSSGVRQIADAVGSGETERVAATSVVLRRMSLLTGLFGAALLILFARQVSFVTFGNRQHATAIAALSIAVCFTLISAGQGALVQGMRRIADLARIGVIGTLLGALSSIVLVYFLRERGVVPSLIVIAVMTALASWWYSSRISIQTPAIPVSAMVQQAGELLKLGFAFMFSGLMTIGVAYVIRITVLRRVGFEATGLYQSAWTLGGLYVGFILQAMGADFYPRLTAHAKVNAACNRLVNEQARVGLLLAGPGVIATLTFAPFVIALFYSARFQAAVPILRWICLGTIIQVVTWPMGFIIVAKARQLLFVFCELAWTIVSLGLAWVCVSRFGLNGVGIAFFGSYIFHAALIYAVVRRISGFQWSAQNLRTGLLFLALITTTFGAFYLLPFYAAEAIGTVAALGTAIYSIRTLVHLVSPDQVPTQIRRILSLCGFTSRQPVQG